MKRKVYSDPALKDNKKWSIYISQSLYKKFKTKSVTHEIEITQMYTDALSIYMEIFPELEKLSEEAIMAGLKLDEYIAKVLKERNHPSV